MLNNISLSSIVFIDVETASLYPKYEDLNKTEQRLWDSKCQRLQQNGETPEELYEKAGIYSEFSKVICISVGYIYNNSKTDPCAIKIKSVFDNEESALLTNFIKLLNAFDKAGRHILCAHNGKEFDFPFLARRILINRLELPEALNIAGKKPWEISHLDTMSLWKFGDYKHYTSLTLLANSFGISNPKEDMSGSDVGRVYWEDKNLKKIIQYCQKDVLTVAQLLLCFMGKPTIDKKDVTFV